MPQTHTFRFASPALTTELAHRLKKAGIRHVLDPLGAIRYPADDEERIENEFIGPMRGEMFPSWQLLFCPADWVDRYKQYMRRHHIRFQEQTIDDEISFIISRRYRPHSWNLMETPARIVNGPKRAAKANGSGTFANSTRARA